MKRDGNIICGSEFLRAHPFKSGSGTSGVPNDSRRFGLRLNFQHNLNTLCRRFRRGSNKSGQIATRFGEARYQSKLDKVRRTCGYNGNK